MANRSTRRQQRQRLLRGLSHASIGLEMGLSVGVGYGLGVWLDGVFGTSWLVIAMSVLGAAAGFRALFRLGTKMQREAEAEDEAGREGREDRS